MKVKHFMESSLGNYRTPPLDREINAWIDEQKGKIKILDIKYSSGVTMDTSKEEDGIKTTMFVSGALVFYEEV
tara:strand:- start:4084 stop:4302 length:219 start_codon:yes stop_codon:yes gene_type:complete